MSVMPAPPRSEARRLDTFGRAGGQHSLLGWCWFRTPRAQNEIAETPAVHSYLLPPSDGCESRLKDSLAAGRHGERRCQN